MSPEAWKTLGTFLSGAAFLGIVVAFFRFLTSGRKQDAAEFVRLTARIVHLEQRDTECQKKVLDLSTEVAGLRAAVARLDATSGTANIVADDRGVIREWNPGATALFGWSTLEAVGQHVSILVPLRLRERHDSSFLRAVQENRGPNPEAAARIRESYALTKTGDEIPVTITLLGWAFEGKRLYSAEIKRR